MDYADNDSADAAGQGHQTRGASMDGGGGARNATMLHQGVPKPAAEAIAAVLQSMNANQLYEVMVDMKVGMGR